MPQLLSSSREFRPPAIADVLNVTQVRPRKPVVPRVTFKVFQSYYRKIALNSYVIQFQGSVEILTPHRVRFTGSITTNSPSPLPYRVWVGLTKTNGNFVTLGNTGDTISVVVPFVTGQMIYFLMGEDSGQAWLEKLPAIVPGIGWNFEFDVYISISNSNPASGSYIHYTAERSGNDIDILANYATTGGYNAVFAYNRRNTETFANLEAVYFFQQIAAVPETAYTIPMNVSYGYTLTARVQVNGTNQVISGGTIGMFRVADPGA